MKKTCKLVALLLVAILTLGVFATTGLAATEYRWVKTATPGSTVTLRKTASTSASSLGKVKDGTKVVYLGKSSDWSKVSVGGKTGYIKTEFLRTTAPGSSSSATSSGSVISAPGQGVTNRSVYIYKAAAIKDSNRDGTLSKGVAVTVTKVMTDWVQINYNGKTRFLIRKYVDSVGSGSSAGGSSETVNASKYSADIISGVYTTSAISAPSGTITSKEAFWNAINYYLSNYNTSFTIKTSGGTASWLPTSVFNLEFAYIESRISPVGGPATGTTTFNVKYNEAGRVIQAFKNGNTISSSDSKAFALYNKVKDVLNSVSGKSTYDKIVYFHDYLVRNAAYTSDASTAYNALIEGKAQCQGYSEAMGLLLTCAGIENRIVWALSNVSNDGTHAFNKVKLDGNWYNVDVTVDDPKDNTDPTRVRHTYCLVTDQVSAQRYSWENKRYPASTTKNNWFMRNNLVATSASELLEIVKKAKANGEKSVEVWVEDYTKTKYLTTEFGKYATAYPVYGADTSKACATGIFCLIK